MAHHGSPPVNNSAQYNNRSALRSPYNESNRHNSQTKHEPDDFRRRNNNNVNDDASNNQSYDHNYNQSTSIHWDKIMSRGRPSHNSLKKQNKHISNNETNRHNNNGLNVQPNGNNKHHSNSNNNHNNELYEPKTNTHRNRYNNHRQNAHNIGSNNNNTSYEYREAHKMNEYNNQSSDHHHHHTASPHTPNNINNKSYQHPNHNQSPYKINDSDQHNRHKITSNRHHNTCNKKNEYEHKLNEYNDSENNTHIDHYHSNRNNNNNNTNYHPDKFKNCALSFEDQIYLIFKDAPYHSLYLNQIQKTLLEKYGTINIDKNDVFHIRFLYRDHSDKQLFKMRLFVDDICPKGFECDHRTCHRIHCIINEHICFEVMEHCNCDKIHVPRRKITDMILEIILRIYKKLTIRHNSKYNYRKRLMFCDIFEHVFINTFRKLHGLPFPGIIAAEWKLLLSRYNKFYFDCEQQVNGVDGAVGDRGKWGRVKLWKTVWYDSNKWMIRICGSLLFFINRTCFNYLMYQFGGKGQMPCFVKPAFCCPYFHLHSAHVTVSGFCEACARGQECSRFHIKYCEQLPKSYAMPGNPYYRYRQQLDEEIKSRLNYVRNEIRIIDMTENDIECHDKWCTQLMSEFVAHRNRSKSVEEHLNNFHVQKDKFGIKFDETQMNRFKPLQVVDKIYNFLDDYGQKIMDIELRNIQKNIILKFRVVKYKSVCSFLCSYVALLEKQFCFGRRISLKVKLEVDVENVKNTMMIFEFENVNTFLSVQLLRQWFVNTVNQHIWRKYMFSFSNLYFVEGSYHFLYANQPSYRSYNAVAYYVNLNLNPESVLHPNINNIDVKLETLQNDEISLNIHNKNTRFIDYGMPKVYCFLTQPTHNSNANVIPIAAVEKQQLQPEQQQQQQLHDTDDNVCVYDDDNESYCTPTPPPTNTNTQQQIIEIKQNQYNDDEYNYSDTDDTEYEPEINRNDNNINNKSYQRNDTDTYKINRNEYEHKMNSNNEPVPNGYSKDIDEAMCYKCVHVEKNCNLCKPLRIDESAEINVYDYWNEHKKNINKKILQPRKHCAFHVDVTECVYQRETEREINALCRYCLLQHWDDEHKQKCLFVPDWMKRGNDTPPQCLRNETFFIGNIRIKDDNFNCV